jgi:chemotaxis protein CheD
MEITFKTSTHLDQHFLFPSEIYVSTKPCLVQTILGSCVSICLFDNRRKIGGINHYMVPLWNGEGFTSAKYGNIAIEMLIKRMESLGASRKDWTCKIFGGASQYDYNNVISVGEKNIQLAENILSEFGIQITAVSVGGEKGRKIIFATHTGKVMMKYIDKQK